MKSILAILFILASLMTNLSASEYTHFEGTEQDYENSQLDNIFTNYEVLELSNSDLFNLARTNRDELTLDMTLGKSLSRSIHLYQHEVISEDFQVTYLNGHSSSKVDPIELYTYKGWDEFGGSVIMTVSEFGVNAVYRLDEGTFYLERLSKIVDTAASDLYVIYKESDVIPDSNIKCMHTEVRDQKEKIEDSRDEHTQEHSDVSRNGDCVTFEMAIAVDYSLTEAKGGAEEVQAHILELVPLVEELYTAFSLEFEVAEFAIATCSTCNPWSSSNNPETLLVSFSFWAQDGGFSEEHDSGTLWTDIEFSFPGVGLAFVGTICDANKYQLVRDYSNNTYALRVMWGHELGHGFGASHIGSNTAYVMNSVVVPSATEFSSTSIAVINNFINSASCLSDCGSNGGGGNPEPDPEADLIIQSPNIAASSTSEYSIEISCQVMNVGETMAASSSLKYYLSTDDNYDTGDTYLTSDFVSSLGINQTSSESALVSIPNGLPSGTYYVLFKADANGQITESNENNNIGSYMLLIEGEEEPEPEPEVEIDYIVSSSDAIGAEDNPLSFQVAATVTNIGSSAAPNSSTLKYYLSTNSTYGSSDIELGSDYVSALGASGISNEGAILTLDENTAPGNYYIIFRADANNQVDEVNESNNYVSQAIEVMEEEEETFADLLFTSVNATASESDPYQFDLSAIVRNEGTATSAYNKLRYYFSEDMTYDNGDIYLTYDNVSSLGVGATNSESATVNIPNTTEEGTYYFLFRADADGIVEESNENNNLEVIEIQIQGSGVVDDPNALHEIGETGKINITQNGEDQWHAVTFENEYINPVVVAPSVTENGSDPLVVAVRNVTATGCEIQLDEWDYLDNVHLEETVCYMVIEAGQHELSDGTVVQAGFSAANKNFSGVEYLSPFSSTPIVVTQVVNPSVSNAIGSRLHAVNNNGFQLRIQRQELYSGNLAEEMVAWIAIEAATGSSNNKQYEVAKTANEVTHQYVNISYEESFSTTPILVHSMQSYYGVDPSGLRCSNLNNYSYNVRVQEEQSKDGEMGHIDEVVGYFLFEEGGIFGTTQTTIDMIGETGRLFVTQNNGYQWKTVNMKRTYTNPVVVAQSLNSNGSDPAVIRVKDVTNNSFKVKVDEWDYLDGAHATELVSYIVLEEGTHELASGTTIQAGHVNANGAFSTVSFNESFSNSPIVLSQVVSENSSTTVVTRHQAVSYSNFKLRLQSQESMGAPSTESIDWIAIKVGTGEALGQKFEAGKTPAVVGNTFQQVNFVQNFTSQPIALQAMQTYNGSDPSFVRYKSLNANNYKVRVQEEQSADGEMIHGGEVIGCFLIDAGPIFTMTEFEGSGKTDGLAIEENDLLDEIVEEEEILKTVNLTVYPNPSQGEVFVNIMPESDIENGLLAVFSMDGRQVTSIAQNDMEAGQNYHLDLNHLDLSKGMYLVSFVSENQPVITQQLAITK